MIWHSARMNQLTKRQETYRRISNALSCMSHAKLKQLLADGKVMHKGIGGASSQIAVDETPIFVKKVPITDLELQPENYMSTANMFNLPMYYHYGVGSTGFGVWRELAAHTMTTNSVITGQCPNFPMMYHWRILPNHPGEFNIFNITAWDWDDIEKYCQYWENSETIRSRAENILNASTHVALFFEYFPQNLDDWLSAQIAEGGDSAEQGVVFVDEQLKTINKYMKAQDLMHLDAHFENILTDGKQLYLTDFGFALSSKFDLTPVETAFLNQHDLYDQFFVATNLVQVIVGSLFGKAHWEMRLREYLAGELNQASAIMNAIIIRYAPTALLMNEFFQKLRQESKLTPYPGRQVEKLLRQSQRK